MDGVYIAYLFSMLSSSFSSFVMSRIAWEHLTYLPYFFSPKCMLLSFYIPISNVSKNLKLQLLLLMCLLLLSLSAKPNFTAATMVNRVPCTSLFCVLSQNGESLIRLVESFGSPVATLPTSTTRVLVVVLIQGQSQEIFLRNSYTSLARRALRKLMLSYQWYLKRLIESNLIF